MNLKKPELLSPIQDFTSLQAAIAGGCDAVYFGIRGFNMRAGAKNFTGADLKKVVKICQQYKVRTYLALNTIIYENELKQIEIILKKAKTAGVSAVICWDLGVVEQAVKLGLETHLSTQASVANSMAAKFYKKLGIKRIVLARECSLEQIKEIKKQTDIEIEIFIHGAMCVSESGRCFLSQFIYGKSANRGECLQPCRRKYLIKQTDGNEEFELGEDYVLSPKDLCTLPFIEKLIEAGIDCFKIEGRNRSPEYVKRVTSVYREIIDYYFRIKNNKLKLNKKEFEDLKKKLLVDLGTVYNRGFGDGFYLGKPINQWTHNYGSQATVRKIHLGRVMHYYSKIGVAEIEIQANKKLKIKDEIIIEGPTTGVYNKKIESMEMEHQKIKIAQQGDIIAVKVEQRARANDLVYKIVEKN